MTRTGRTLTDAEQAAARTISPHLWKEPYQPGRGPAHWAVGPWWPRFLRSRAAHWEGLAKAARVVAAAIERSQP